MYSNKNDMVNYDIPELAHGEGNTQPEPKLSQVPRGQPQLSPFWTHVIQFIFVLSALVGIIVPLSDKMGEKKKDDVKPTLSPTSSPSSSPSYIRFEHDDVDDSTPSLTESVDTVSTPSNTFSSDKKYRISHIVDGYLTFLIDYNNAIVDATHFVLWKFQPDTSGLLCQIFLADNTANLAVNTETFAVGVDSFSTHWWEIVPVPGENTFFIAYPMGNGVRYCLTAVARYTPTGILYPFVELTLDSNPSCYYWNIDAIE